MSSKRKTTPVNVIGIDIGKNSFHVVGQDQRGAIIAGALISMMVGSKDDQLQSETGYMMQDRTLPDQRNLLHRTAGPYIGSKCEELDASKASLHYPDDQTLFGRCEKYRRRAQNRNSAVSLLCFSSQRMFAGGVDLFALAV
jgi:hypothetical protein